tara:strand:+ start:2346 stop:4607 length:2262 start_codon:yes stop_codon:yes gene_type:complete
MKKKISNKNMTPQILNLIKKYNLNWEYIGWYRNLEGKKELCRPAKDKKTQNRDEIIKKFKWIADKENAEFNVAYLIDIKDTPLANIDIDEDVDIETVNKKISFTSKTLGTKGNTKGFHFIVECDDFINCKKSIDCLKHFEGDIITDTIMETENKEFFNNEIVKVSKEDILKIAKFKFEKSKINNNSNSYENENEIKEFTYATFEGNEEELEEIVMNIPVKYADNYLEWIKVISILKKYNFYDLAQRFSKKSKSYVEERFNNDYNNASFKDYDIGTIYHYSKDNKTNYEKIINKYKKLKLEEEKKNKIEHAELEYSKIEENFNKNHFKIINKNIFIKVDENDKLITFTPKNFKEAYYDMTYEGINKNGEIENKAFIEKYMKANPNMRKYIDIDTYPDKSKCPSNHYNLWRDFDVEKITEYEEDTKGLEFILNHIKILCNNDTLVYEYVLDYFAHMFQRPHEKPGKFILFVSLQGTGKSLLFQLLTNMLGEEKVLETPIPERDVWGNHNSRMMNSYLVNIEELKFLSSKGSEGIFKNYITGNTMIINPKGKDQINITSYHRFIGSMNPEDSDIPIKSVEGDRRNLLIRCSDEKKGDIAYFNELLKYVNSKNLQKTFYKYLMNRPNIDIFVSQKIPITSYQETIQEAFEPVIDSFIKDSILDETIKSGLYKAITLYDIFKEFKTSRGINFEISATSFGTKLKLKNLKGIIKVRRKDGNYYDIDTEILKEELKLNNVEQLDNNSFCMDSDSDTEFSE